MVSLAEAIKGLETSLSDEDEDKFNCAVVSNETMKQTKWEMKSHTYMIIITVSTCMFLAELILPYQELSSQHC